MLEAYRQHAAERAALGISPLPLSAKQTEELIGLWLASGADEMKASCASPAVQDVDEIQREVRERLGRLNEVANRIYDRWTEGLAR